MNIIADTNIPFVKECFSSIGDVSLHPGRQITPQIVKNADALLVRSVTNVNKDLLEASSVKFVGTATIGFEHVDIDYLAARKIGFASAPGSNANSVAEYIIAALFVLAKRYKFELKGKSIGIVGVGNVGSKVEIKARALGLKVFLNDPPLQRKTNDPKYLPLEKLFDCDIVTLHTPLTSEGIDKTYHLADEKFLNSLKQDCLFFNTCRGGVTDTTALKNALRDGKLKAAVLDVWENEPDIDPELLEMAAIATPHIAGYSFDGKVVGMIMIYKALCSHFNLKPQHETSDFLPESNLPVLRIDRGEGSGTQQDILFETVKKIYNIEADDHRLRQLLQKDPPLRGSYFDQLRKTYPVRREFGNTQLILTACPKSLADKLKGIGFKV